MRRCRFLAVAIVVAGCGGRARELSPIRLVSMGKLGADSGDGAIATTPVVSARHPGGFRVVIAAFSTISVLPLVFSDDGRFLGTLRGDTAPMRQFTQPLFTRIGPGDSLWVFDNAKRVLVFDSLRHYVRTIALATTVPDATIPISDAVVLGDGHFAATTDAPAVIRLFNANGVAEHDIGLPDAAGRGPRYPRHIARAADGTLWTTTIYGRWRLEHWDTTGRLLNRVDPVATWLVDSVAAGRTWYPRPDQPPPPVIRAIWLDAVGRLWVLGEAADRHWREGFIAADPAVPNSEDHIDSDRYYDTIVEVRDPKTGTLIASARFDVACSSIAEPGVLVHEVLTHAGWVRAELLRIVFDESRISTAQ